jgi:hypothetical protein
VYEPSSDDASETDPSESITPPALCTCDDAELFGNVYGSGSFPGELVTTNCIDNQGNLCSGASCVYEWRLVTAEPAFFYQWVLISSNCG